MAKELSGKLGEMEYDGLITGLNPAVIVSGGVVTKGESAVTLKRGTVLSKGTDGKLAVMTTSATPDSILAEDVEVGTTEDANVIIYTAGCFDPDKCIVAEGYALTEADKDVLRTKNIYFKSPAEA